MAEFEEHLIQNVNSGETHIALRRPEGKRFFTLEEWYNGSSN